MIQTSNLISRTWMEKWTWLYCGRPLLTKMAGKMRERQIVEMKSSGPVQTSNFSFTELNYLFGSTQIIKIDRWFTRRTFLSYLLRALLDTSLYSMLIIFPSSFVTFRRCFLPNFFQCWYWSPDLPLHKQCKMQRIFRLARQEFLPLKTQSSGYKLSCYNQVYFVVSEHEKHMSISTTTECFLRQVAIFFHSHAHAYDERSGLWD